MSCVELSCIALRRTQVVVAEDDDACSLEVSQLRDLGAALAGEEQSGGGGEERLHGALAGGSVVAVGCICGSSKQQRRAAAGGIHEAVFHFGSQAEKFGSAIEHAGTFVEERRVFGDGGFEVGADVGVGGY